MSNAVQCKAPGCTKRAYRWYGWNMALLGQPELVKAPFCSRHAMELRARTGNKVIAFDLVKGRLPKTTTTRGGTE